MTEELERGVGALADESLDGVFEIYRRHGFDAGYHQALRDQLEGLVLQAEGFLRASGGGAEGEAARRGVYGFVGHLEKVLSGMSPLTCGEGFAGGEGI